MTNTSNTFGDFILEIGIQRQREGVKISHRYVYLNRALDIFLDNPKVQIKEIYAIIAKEQNVLVDEVKYQILLAMKEIFGRRNQKEEFIKIFGTKKEVTIKNFLISITEAYQEKLNSQRGPS